MEKITIPHTFLKGRGANATKFNSNFDALKESVNNTIDEFDTKTNLSLNNIDDTGLDAILPVGAIIPLTRTSAPTNSRLLLCNGASVSRSLYSKLFNIIGTHFGVGNGSTTFNLPDYRGQFLRGLGGNSAANIYTKQTEGLPNIIGAVPGSPGTPSGAFSAGSTLSGQPYYSASAMKMYNFSASYCNAIYGASNHVTPENYGVYFFIRY